jgi:hypothetical protein
MLKKVELCENNFLLNFKKVVAHNEFVNWGFIYFPYFSIPHEYFTISGRVKQFKDIF